MITKTKTLKIAAIVFILSAVIPGLTFAETSLSKPSSVSSIAPSNNIPVTVPNPPDLNVKSYILIDARSGNVLAEKNSDTRLPPASLTKLMTLYIAAQDLKKGQIHMTDQVTISENAWRMGGSRMFIKVGSTVPLQQLIDGVVIASGNDAAFAIAEFIGGNEPSFVKQMNQTAKDLNLENTNFSDSNGLPADNHYSSAHDLSKLARSWILDLPEYYRWFQQKWITFNGIKQPNRNRLLWRDPSVDGMKTGHTDEAGYCFVGSAVRNDMRLIVVIMGAPSDSTRFNNAEALLNYGYRYYESHKLYSVDKPLTKKRVWFGKTKMLALGLKRDLYATTQVGDYKDLKASLIANKDLQAPIAKGQIVGTVNVTLKDKIISSEPLVAMEDVERTGFFGSFFEHIALFFHKIL